MTTEIKENLKGCFYVEITNSTNQVFKTMTFKSRDKAKEYAKEFIKAFSECENILDMPKTNECKELHITDVGSNKVPFCEHRNEHCRDDIDGLCRDCWIEKKEVITKLAYSYNQVLDIITSFSNEVNTNLFYTDGEELRKELEPYIINHIMKTIPKK